MSETLQTIQLQITQQAIAIDEIHRRQGVLDIKTTNGTLVLLAWLCFIVVWLYFPALYI